MKSKLYKISYENYITMLSYYYITKEKAKKYFDYIKKYKDITENYCSNIKNLFNKEENIFNINKILDDTETIIIDYNGKLNYNYSNSSHIHNNNSKIKNINILPIQHNIGIINKFFNNNIQSLQLFIKSLETVLNQMNQKLEQSQCEIENIKVEYTRAKQIYIQKYSEFDILNKQLIDEYAEGERKLVEYSLKIKSLNNNDKDKEEKLYNEINLKLIEIKENQNAILEKFNNLDNFGKIYNDYSNKKINQIQLITSSVFQELEKFINYFLIFYKKSFLFPISPILNIEKVKINNNEFNDLLKQNIVEIDKNAYNFNLNEYEIRVIENNKVDKDEIYEERKCINDALKEFSYDIATDEKKEELDEKDIFFIAKKMYNFEYVNKKNYILNIESEKLKMKNVINKLTFYSKVQKISSSNSDDKDIKNEINENDHINKEENNYEKNKINKKEEKLTQEEIDYLCKLMNKRDYRVYFLIKINNFRAIGAFEMPLETFEYMIQIFKVLSKYFYLDKKNEEDEPALDLYLVKLVIILSQTFYCMKDGKKVYIQNELKNEKIYHSEEFWKKLLKMVIENEINICKNNDKDIGIIEDEETIINRRNRISFAQIIPYISGMNGFGISTQKMKNIILPFLDEFNMNEENKQIILNVLENPDNI